MGDILAVDTWKANYLFGIPDEDAQGNPFSTDSYQYHLNLGYAALEAALDVTITPVTVTDERHDYWEEEFRDWGYLRLFKKPAISVTQVSGKFPFYTNSVLTIPPEWVSLDSKTGIMNIIPVSGTLSQFIFQAGGSFVPTLFRYNSHVPRFWSVDYQAGFGPGTVPADLNDAAAKMACMSVMNVLGDIVGGAGVLGSSVGLDGVSQFLSLTKTATTGAFYARTLQYRTELFGNGSGGPGSQIYTLRRKYRGIQVLGL